MNNLDGMQQPEETRAPETAATDQELLESVDPETRAMAEQISAALHRLGELERLVEEQDQEYERGWVDGAARTAQVVGGEPAQPEPRSLVRRVAGLERQVADLVTIAKVFASSPGAEERIAKLEETVAQVATAEHIVRRATGREIDDPADGGEVS